MCGIAGYLLPRTRGASQQTLNSMLATLRPRGPDDEGLCLIRRQDGRVSHFRSDRTSASAGARLPHVADPGADRQHDAAFLHTRFAVVAPGTDSHQPFVSRDGTITAVFHGEVHNYVELRTELETGGVPLRTRGDTEVLVEGYRAWGDDLWPRMNGFWAVALFDARTGETTLCRDRFGIAPLYLLDTADGCMFASRIDSLMAAAPDTCRVHAGAVTGFLDTGFRDCDEHTCYAPVRSCPAGSVLRFGRGTSQLADAAMHRYWSYPAQTYSIADLSIEDAVTTFRELFFDAVAVRLRADIPVACELSGGLDSTSIVAAAAMQSTGVTTYTLKVAGHDEEPFACTMRERYPIDYRVVQIPDAHVLADADGFARIMEEPFHSPNVRTHFLLRERMKEDGFGVALCGSGGDEALAGYEEEFWPGARAGLLSHGRRAQVFAYDAAVATRSWTRARQALRQLVRTTRRTLIGPPARRDVTDSTAHMSGAAMLRERYGRLGYHDRRLFHFTTAMLPYYLTSDDHLTMALPLEQRTPFLDHRIVDLGLRLPPEYLFRLGWTKYVLRRAMEPYLPAAVTWRREKMGFPFPLRPFLSRERAALEPLLAPVRAAALMPPDGDYDELMRTDPHRLWRICSTGLWLCSGAAPAVRSQDRGLSRAVSGG